MRELEPKPAIAPSTAGTAAHRIVSGTPERVAYLSAIAAVLFCIFIVLIVQPGHVPDPLGFGDSAAWPVLCFAFALPMLALVRPDRKAWRTALDPYVAAYLAAVFLTWPTAYDSGRTLVAITGLIGNVLIFYAVVTMARSHARLATIGLVIVVAGSAVVQAVALGFHLDVGLLTRPKVYDRPPGWSGYPELGLLGAIQFAILLAAFQAARGWRWRGALLILVAVCAAELAFLYARLPWIATGVIFCIALAVAFRNGGWRPLAAIVLGIALIGGGLVTSNATFRRMAFEAIGRPAPHLGPAGIALEISPPQSRVTIWSRTLRMIRDHWAVGVGLGNFRDVYEPRYNPEPNSDGRRGVHAHNLWLHQTAELGVGGGVALAGLWATALVVGWRGLQVSFPSRAAFYTVLVIAAVALGDNLFASIGGPGARLHTLAWMGLALVASRQSARRSPYTSKDSSRPALAHACADVIT